MGHWTGEFHAACSTVARDGRGFAPAKHFLTLFSALSFNLGLIIRFIWFGYEIFEGSERRILLVGTVYK